MKIWAEVQDGGSGTCVVLNGNGSVRREDKEGECILNLQEECKTHRGGKFGRNVLGRAGALLEAFGVPRCKARARAEKQQTSLLFVGGCSGALAGSLD